jgi:hypothetical protein
MNVNDLNTPLFLSYCKETRIFLADFRKKNPQVTNFMKIHLMAAIFYMRADGEI